MLASSSKFLTITYKALKAEVEHTHLTIIMIYRHTPSRQWRRQKFLPAGALPARTGALQSLMGYTSWHRNRDRAYKIGPFSNSCFRFQILPVPPIQHAFFVGCAADRLTLWIFSLWLIQVYIRFTKLPMNIKPKVNFVSTSVGKTQSSCLLSVTGYQYTYR